MTTTQKVGIVFLATPIPLFIINFIVQIIVRASISPTEGSVQTLMVANMIFGIVGILAVLGILIGMPIGAILLVVGRKRSSQ